LGVIYVWKKQHDQAVAEAERAIALDPNDADCHVTLGVILAFAGRPEEGIGWIERGMRLNPLAWRDGMRRRLHQARDSSSSPLILHLVTFTWRSFIASYARRKRPGLRWQSGSGSVPVSLWSG
jgi:tetratricopeptide (TPR) repeat protein